MKLRTMKYFFDEAFKSIFRNRFMSITSILTVASCILILTFSYCIAINVDHILDELENTVGIKVFIDDDLTEEDLFVVQNEIETLENVKSTTYISPEEALESMAESFGEIGDILLGLNDRQLLRRSFYIELYSAKEQANTISQLEDMMESGFGIAKVYHAVEIIELLVMINNIVRIISIIVVVVLGLLSVVIIMNTIKLTVNNRKNDIGIMKYVGATDWFIKWPFIIEGILIGIIGASIPLFVSTFYYEKITVLITERIITFDAKGDNIMTFLTGVEIFPNLIPIMFSLGILIGSIGSILSVKKYLDV